MRDDILGMRNRWREVVETCRYEGKNCPPSVKPLWEEVQKLAEEYVEYLHEGRKLELAACKAWQRARAAMPTKKGHLSVVDEPEDEEQEGAPEPKADVGPPKLQIVGKEPPAVSKKPEPPSEEKDVLAPGVVVDTYGLPGLDETAT